ncbi:MAG: flagellar basal body P-ring protein FlgI [Gammaproteobacteria bacterium]|jgi:flagellar P-ring protein precursor FlgI|nr:flagellar basal body P-ring protein FlgI [Gammaproteobacteria bacterium]
MRQSTIQKFLLAIGLAAAIVIATPVRAERIKDIAALAAARPNQLMGYGIVVGLQGTGDGKDISFTIQTLRETLARLGSSVDGPLSSYDLDPTAVKDFKIENAAAVMVTAELPAFAKPGQKIDVNVAAVAKAKSLRGGVLLMTRLRGPDGQTYAVAQGPLAASGFSADAAGSSVAVGVSTSARIPGGGLVEREVAGPLNLGDNVTLNLTSPDFANSARVMQAINEKFGNGTAEAVDAVSVKVKAPTNSDARVAFVGMLEELEINAAEPPARVVVNSRTGTVVISRNVRVSAAAVSQGDITVTVDATNEVSQPNPLSQGQTTPVQNAQVKVSEDKKNMVLFKPGAELRELVNAVNQIGASPTALISILEALQRAGALRAELIVI